MFIPMRGGQTDMGKVEEAKKKLVPVLAVLDKHLAKGGPHMVGDAFTLADIAYMPYVEYATQTPAKDVILDHANVAAWWKRISERPTWKHVTAK
jgi:glutathione S-transferase